MSRTRIASASGIATTRHAAAPHTSDVGLVEAPDCAMSDATHVNVIGRSRGARNNGGPGRRTSAGRARDRAGPLRPWRSVAAAPGSPRRAGPPCLLYTSDAADERSSVDLGGRRIIKKKKK